jgi:hypothetical protein
MEEPKKCFVRHEGDLWRKATPYQEAALRIYQQEEGDDIRILVPRGELNPFIAYFSRINDEVCIYRTEKGKEVQIIIERPSRIGYINRITMPF